MKSLGLFRAWRRLRSDLMAAYSFLTGGEH